MAITSEVKEDNYRPLKIFFGFLIGLFIIIIIIYSLYKLFTKKQVNINNTTTTTTTTTGGTGADTKTQTGGTTTGGTGVDTKTQTGGTTTGGTGVDTKTQTVPKTRSGTGYILADSLGTSIAELVQNTTWQNNSFECNTTQNDYIDNIKLNYGSGVNNGFLNSISFQCNELKSDGTPNISNQFNGNDTGIFKNKLINGPISVLPYASGDIVDRLGNYGIESRYGTNALRCPAGTSGNKRKSSYITKVELTTGNSTNYGAPVIGQLKPYCSYIQLEDLPPRPNLTQLGNIGDPYSIGRIGLDKFKCNSHGDDYITSIKVNTGNYFDNDPFSGNIINGLEVECFHPKSDGNPNIKNFGKKDNLKNVIYGPISTLPLSRIHNRELDEGSTYGITKFGTVGDGKLGNFQIMTENINCPEGTVLVGLDIGGNRLEHIVPYCATTRGIPMGIIYK
jgi:hypothetical protein